ncbi:hypothetical protein ACFL07_00225 [Pseudomonadota bacterium]
MMRFTFRTQAFLLLVLFSNPPELSADAIVRSMAMFANTIVEYYVEEDHVRLELEIGEGDIASFRNLLPDEIYQQLNFGEEPLAERLKLFAERDLAVLADGEILPGFVRQIGPGTRPLRDEVTGEELPTAEEDAVLVIRATMIFPFQGQPETLTLMAPGATGQANVGFVLYHLGVAVNDFRYLASGFTVTLDWEDPWYSRFNVRGLLRQYSAPMTGFIYVEPFEVRKEIILRPKDLQQWVDLGLEGRDTITVDQQEEIKRRVVEFLKPHFPVSIDGERVEGTVDRVNFLRRTLRSSTVVDGQEIDLNPATLGVIYVFPTTDLPQTVEMTWDLFTEKMQRVPASAVDQAGPLPTFLEPDYNVLEWKNFLKNPYKPELVAVLEPPDTLQKISGPGKWLTLGIALLLLTIAGRKWRKDRTLPITALAGFVFMSAVASWLAVESHKARMNPEKLQQLVGDLLHNVYRSFDFRGEEVIYDLLARSASGDLLTRIYLETRRGLELANQGGARVKVKDIEMQETKLQDSAGQSFNVESRWTVYGSVGHWGHVHQRSNAYHALLEISEVDGTWKLTGLEILEEERL